MRTFAIVNQKGGCGKTTTAINLAGVFAGRGYRTLLVDMDSQGHCAAGLAIPENRIDLHIGDAMAAAPDGHIEVSRLLWRVSRNLDLAPATVRLAALEAPRGELAGKAEPERRLKLALTRFDLQYDICLIDCSPAIGLLAFNALVAADEVLIPVETGFFSLQGASKQVQAIKALGKRLGVTPVHRVLATMHDPASVLSKDLLEELKRRFTSRLIPVVIRFDQSLKEAASFGQPVVEYARESNGAADYGALADWLAANAMSTAGSTRQVSADDPHTSEDTDPEPVQPLATIVTEPAGVEPAPAAMPASRAADMLNRARKLQSKAAEPAAIATVEPKRSPEPSTPLAQTAPAVPLMPEPPPRAPVAFGPQITAHGVIFRAPVSIGRTVAVAGDFNQWAPERTPMRLNPAAGVLESVAFMPPGSVSQYRLVVDGSWIADPYNPCMAPNPFGGTNSVVAVPMGLMADAMGVPREATVVVRPMSGLDIGRPA